MSNYMCHTPLNCDYLTLTDTCDLKWQSSRDGLIITTFVISVLACVIVVLLAILDSFSKKRKDSYTVQEEVKD